MAETQIRLDTQAQDGTLIDSKIHANTITLDKLASIGDGEIIVGAATTGYPTAVTTSGDVTISNTGVMTVASAAITSSKIASATITSSNIASATITGSNIASSTITNTNISSGDFSAILGIGAQNQALNMNSHQINNVSDPTSAQDAATKHYVDTSATPAAGSNTWIQYNNSGAFGASSNLTFTGTELTIGSNAHINVSNGSVSFDGGIISTNGSGNLRFTEAGWITLLNEAYIEFQALTGGNSVTLYAPSTISSSYILLWPTAVASVSGQALVSDTNGNLSFSSSPTLALATNDIFVGNGSNVATAVAMSGDVHIDNTGDTTIQANAIVDSKVSATAAINITKLNTGTNAQIIISNGTTNNWETVSGDVTISNAGVTAIGSGVITNSEINSSANIALSKLADGTNILLADVSATIQSGVRYTYATAQTFVNPGDLIDKAYVDATASGLNVKAAVRLATTSGLTATYSNGVAGVGATLTATSNGALFVDGFPVAVNDRILVKNQVDIPFTITTVTDGTHLVVNSTTGMLAGDPIGQALLLNITSVDIDGVTLHLTSSTGVAVGDTITQGATSSVVVTIPGGTSVTVVSNSGFTAAAAIDTTQFNYYNTYITTVTDGTHLVVTSTTGFYSTSGGAATDIKAATNGIYVVTQTGSGSLPYILTRSSDFNGSIGSVIVAGDFVFVSIGTVNGSTGWVANTQPPFTDVVWGVTEIDWVQFSAAGVVTAGSGLQQVGSVINVVSANGGIVVDAHDIALTLADSTLSIVAGGLKLAPLTSGDILVGNGSNVATAVAMSGDVTISNTGVTTVTSSIPRYTSFVIREVPTGSINSSNVTFTLANTPVVGTECIYLNGLLQNVGGGNDYTISGSVITFNQAPETGSDLLVNYQK